MSSDAADLRSSAAVGDDGEGNRRSHHLPPPPTSPTSPPPPPPPASMPMEYASAELPGLLDSVLSLLSRREAAFAREFFFHGCDVPANISIITNPASLAHASVAYSTCTMVAPRNAHPAAHQLTPTSMAKSIVLVPCFSASNISVGACIEKVDGDMFGKVGFVLNEVVLGRFVRDEETGETLIIVHSLEAVAESPVIISCFRHVSSTAHEHIAIVCRQDGFGIGAMADSVIALCCANEVRNCQVCGKLPVSRCGCTIPMTPMRHSMDFESVSNNMATHYYARWTGTANVLLRKSQADSKADFVAFDLLWSHSLLASNDYTVFSQLRDSVVQQNLASTTPTKTIINRIETAVSYILTTFVDEHAAKTARSPLVMQIEKGRETSRPPEGEVEAQEASPRFRVPQMTSESTAARSSSTGAAALAALWQDAARERNAACTPSAYPSERRLSGADSTGGVVPNVTNVGISSELTPAEMRALMRRERNRAAAARSNEKRKVRLRKLREDVASIRQAVMELSVRETILKSENTFLRKKVKLIS